MTSASNFCDEFAASARRLIDAASEKLGRELSHSWDSLRRILDAILEGALDWGDVARAPEPPSLPDGFDDGALYAATALVGECFRGSFGGEWGEPDPDAGWRIEAPAGAWAVKFDVAALARACPLPEGAEELASEAGAIAENMALALRVCAEFDTEDAAKNLDEEASQLAHLEPDELALWMERQAEICRASLSLFERREVAVDLESGVAAIERFLVRERFLQLASGAQRRRMGYFFGECVRKDWEGDAETPTWAWIEEYEEAGLVASASAAEDAEAAERSAIVLFPVDEVRARRVERAKPDGELAGVAARFRSHAHSGALSQEAIDQLADWSGMAAETDEPDAQQSAATAKMSAEELDDAAEATARPEAAGNKIDFERTTPVKLTPEITLNPGVFTVRTQSQEMSEGNAPDLVLPCRYDLRHGALPLALIPLEGRPLESEADIARELSGALNDIESQLVERKMAPDLFVGFVHSLSAGGDLVIIARPPLILGGERRFDYFFWTGRDDVPEGPLGEDDWERLDIFNEVAVKVRRARFHLQYTGNATEARELLEQALDEAPDDLSALLAMCMLELAIGNQIKARGYVQRILEVYPDHPDTRLLDARFLVDEERFEDAWKQVARLLEENPDNAEALLIGVRMQLMEGDETGARRNLDRVLELDPDNTEASLLERALQRSAVRQ